MLTAHWKISFFYLQQSSETKFPCFSGYHPTFNEMTTVNQNIFFYVKKIQKKFRSKKDVSSFNTLLPVKPYVKKKLK